MGKFIGRLFLIGSLAVAGYVVYKFFMPMPTPVAGESYRHNSTGQIVQVTMVDVPDKLQSYIASEKNRLSYPGRTPGFETQSPAGSPEAADTCVLYTVVTPNADRSRPPAIGYFIYSARNFTRAFTRDEN